MTAQSSGRWHDSTSCSYAMRKTAKLIPAAGGRMAGYCADYEKLLYDVYARASPRPARGFIVL